MSSLVVSSTGRKSMPLAGPPANEVDRASRTQVQGWTATP
jgi:hypothetical protein